MADELTGPDNINIPSSAISEGFTLPAVRFVGVDGNPSDIPQEPVRARSTLSPIPSITEAEMIELSGSTGKLLYFRTVNIEIGDVFYLRERDVENAENGI